MKEKINKLQWLTESGCIRFNRVGDTEFWITPRNKIFLVQGDETFSVSLHGNTTVYIREGSGIVGHKSDVEFSAEVKTKCRELLLKQKQIREEWPSAAEDEAAWSFSNE